MKPSSLAYVGAALVAAFVSASSAFAAVEKIAVNNAQAPAIIHREILSQANEANVTVIVDLGKQRAFLLVDGKAALDTPVSTGKTGHRTPSGTFVITERVRSGKVSNRYYASMPYWMRLGTSPFGLHTGALPGKPASHGCVRLPAKIAPVVFAHTGKGTTVKIVNRWSPPKEVLLASDQAFFKQNRNS